LYSPRIRLSLLILCLYEWHGVEITFLLNIALKVCDRESLLKRIVWRCAARILARTPTILTEAFPEYLHLLQANVGIVPQSRSQPLPSSSLAIHYSVIILLGHAVVYLVEAICYKLEDREFDSR
jgi:hypothetical protein